jgi:hypothetical protein
MNRTLKEATVRRYHYDSQDQLRQHLAAFLDAYNFAKRLKTLKGLTPFESIYKAWTNEPDRFKHEPIQLISGLHTRAVSLPPPRLRTGHGQRPVQWVFSTNIDALRGLIWPSFRAQYFFHRELSPG